MMEETANIQTAHAVRRHGALGISSFVMSLFMVTILFIDLAIAGYMTASGTATRGTNALVGAALFFCWFLALVSIGLGIASYRDKTVRPGLAVAGAGISGSALTISIILMVLGLMSQHH